MQATLEIDRRRTLGRVEPMLFGQFIEHFYRQIYGGIWEPGSPLSDEAGFRLDVQEALKALRIPIIRWPGGCFVSDYHWQMGVGPNRTPAFNRAWRVTEPNAFGTDEFITFCDRIGAAPYICTNAGTGTAEEMADWVEYCNSPYDGRWAAARRQYGHDAPYNVHWWSIGNENWSDGEIGSKSIDDWGKLVRECAKMMLRVDPTIELSAAAIADPAWCLRLLEKSGDLLRWISLHEYWVPAWETNEQSNYAGIMANTLTVERSIRRVEGLLEATGLTGKIRIAFDEWNLRGWYHPGVFDFQKLIPDAKECESFREKNEDDRIYTMADAIFSACFLNGCMRHAQSVGMANFSPIVNTRGAIGVRKDGLTLRPTYYVFKLYRDLLRENVADSFLQGNDGPAEASLDTLATCGKDGITAVLINRHATEDKVVRVLTRGDSPAKPAVLHILSGDGPDACNTPSQPNAVTPEQRDIPVTEGGWTVTLPPHAVCLLVEQA